MTGIELIAQERKEQIEKHKWNDENVYYLTSLVSYCILEDDDAEKDNIGEFLFKDQNGFKLNPIFRSKIDNKSKIERLSVAGALIAAEIDRLQKTYI